MQVDTQRNVILVSVIFSWRKLKPEELKMTRDGANKVSAGVLLLKHPPHVSLEEEPRCYFSSRYTSAKVAAGSVIKRRFICPAGSERIYGS